MMPGVAMTTSADNVMKAPVEARLKLGRVADGRDERELEVRALKTRSPAEGLLMDPGDVCTGWPCERVSPSCGRERGGAADPALRWWTNDVHVDN